MKKNMQDNPTIIKDRLKEVFCILTSLDIITNFLKGILLVRKNHPCLYQFPNRRI